ncbi:FMN-linked oxidoreductase [Durotheca rogersii]|uniref:FMN-linked oxidoreductase n=1 Tax=Durotheca rogersii TaxID=419775 RepID=UPI00221FA153|nr:FMN-linked oxidoreductase [Durotheca rogersii]KAI5860576.1 FMN-linked oxidoreductase [Durotheca rogersii]
MASSSRLFQPLKVGRVTLQHRLAMAPMTRFRADANHVPLPSVKEYYEQRGAVPGSLLITEGTFITKRAGGYNFAPGIWSQEQIAAWKEVTDAVHAKGSFIYVQLWALGRTADPEVTKADGVELHSASAIPYAEGKPIPKPLTIDEIQSYVADYAQAARNAIEAGFDGVEVHGANGYLPDQFLQDTSNQREDRYGGSIENRARFPLEVVSAVVSAIGADRTAIRLSPWSTFQGMRMEDPIPQFTYLIRELRKLKLAYLHVTQAYSPDDSPLEGPAEKATFAVEAWDSEAPVIIAGGLQPDSARALVDDEQKHRNVIAGFGRSWISTPDLPFRLKHGIPFAPHDYTKFYSAGAPEGYIDYPFSEQFAKTLKL